MKLDTRTATQPDAQLERKFVSLAEFKMTDDDAGYLEGYASVYNEIDEGGDLILPSALANKDEAIQNGFTAHSHDWSFLGVVGYPVEMIEDERGLFVRSKFHSDPQAQLVRTRVKERLADGKQVGLSIGYQLAAEPKFIYPKEYKDELPKYVPAARLEANLAKAERFPVIRLISAYKFYEHSIVTAPMNKLAQATGVKSEMKDEQAQPEPAVAAELPDTKLTNALINLKGALEAEVTFKDHSEAVVAAAEGFAKQAETVVDMLSFYRDRSVVRANSRFKEGRTLSAATSERLKQCRDRLTDAKNAIDMVDADLGGLLEAKPKPAVEEPTALLELGKAEEPAEAKTALADPAEVEQAMAELFALELDYLLPA